MLPFLPSSQPQDPQGDAAMKIRDAIRETTLAVFLFASACAAVRGEGPTYHRDIEPLLQKRCQECHRPGQVGPFSLLTYEQAKKRGSDLAAVTAEHRMPPWPASTQVGGPFLDARVLSESEISLIDRWVEAGAPEGDAKDAPPRKDFPTGWPLGEPDLVLTSPEAFHLAADGPDEYMVFVLPSKLAQGRWVDTVDFRPGNAKVVHHILAAYDVAGKARKKDSEEPGPGYHSFGGFGVLPAGRLGGWAPGKLARHSRPNVGRFLPAGADVLLQVHYHKSGKPETDASAIGIYFAKQEPDQQLRPMVTPSVADIELKYRNVLKRPNLGFTIPAGQANVEFKASSTVRYDAHLISVVPHMHLLGKDFLMTATMPSGETRTLIKIDRWNFNWQSTYEFVDPPALPKGTRIDIIAHFDNSAANPSNPNSPPQDVHWGEQTTDEMCIGFMQLTADSEHLRAGSGRRTEASRRPGDEPR